MLGGGSVLDPRMTSKTTAICVNCLHHVKDVHGVGCIFTTFPTIDYPYPIEITRDMWLMTEKTSIQINYVGHHMHYVRPVLLQFHVFHYCLEFVAGICRLCATHTNQYHYLSKSKPNKLAFWLCLISPGTSGFSCKRKIFRTCKFCTSTVFPV